MAKRKKRQRKNNDPQSIIQKTKYGAARSLLKPGMISDAPEGSAGPVPHVATVDPPSYTFERRSEFLPG